MDGFDEADYDVFTAQVRHQFGLRLEDYKATQMQRRLRALAEAHRCASFAALVHRMQACPKLSRVFLDTITINVTELMRNPERFEELAREILPTLLAQKKSGPLSAWSAGCSYGAEAYTLAMLLHELEPTGGHRICGTDISEAILAKAGDACFTETDMARFVRDDARPISWKWTTGTAAAGPSSPGSVPCRTCATGFGSGGTIY